MKNVTLVLGLVLLLILPSSCTEDAVLESLVSASRTDNNLVLGNPGDTPKPELDLTNPVLKFRVDQIRDSIKQFMTPEIQALQQQGRIILRQRGVDPDTAFSGGPNDIRLALIPTASDVLGRINEPFAKRGYYIQDLFYLDEESIHTPTGENTPGPWDFYWEQQEKTPWLQLSKEELDACFQEVLAKVGLVIGSAAGAVKFYDVGAKALIAFAAGEVVLSVAAGLGIAGGLYFIYKMDECVQKTMTERCEITISLDEYCRRLREAGEKDAGCDMRMLAAAKMAGLELRLGTDTLSLVVDPDFVAPEPEFKDGEFNDSGKRLFN
jgi:hypothetical protein